MCRVFIAVMEVELEVSQWKCIDELLDRVVAIMIEPRLCDHSDI